jgi:glycosyltransferase involved in cell wall biosynthesis
MKIAFYVRRFARGGAELMSADLVAELSRRGHDVWLILDSAPREQPRAVSPSAIEVLERRSILGSARGLAEAARRHDLDVVVSVLPVANLVACSSRVLFGGRTKTVNTWHSYWGSISGIRGRVAHLAVGVLSRACDANVAVSEDLREHLVGLGASAAKLRVIHNGVALMHPTSSYANPRPYILSAGSLTKNKNHRLLIEAFELLRNTHDWDLLIAGDGAERQSLDQFIRARGLADRVRLLGFQSDLALYYTGARMFVLPSNFETFANVLVEALSCGTPVISTDCGGPREILAGGQFGRLVPIGDRVALTQAMLACANEAPPVETLKARADQFSLARTADAYEQLCLSLVGGR